MFIELIDLLRCTQPHEDSWLVATFHEMRERRVIEGLLSCPVCGDRYPITQGVAHFGVAPGTVADGARAAEEDGLRLAAYLNLVEPGIVLLAGAWGGVAKAIAKRGSTVIALNSPRPDDRFASHIRSDGALPLARESMDGIALDSPAGATIESAARALRTGARMIAPVTGMVPVELAELARDERYWVAVREGSGVSAPVQIARSRR